MDLGQILSWVVGAVGLIGFYFAGKRVWWSWYINLGCQILWATFALVTGQLAFLATAAVYFVIFANNAYKWTKEHLYVKKMIKNEELSDGIVIHNVNLVGTPAYSDYDYDLELIARTCHEANRILQLADGDETPSYPWHIAQDWQKESAIEGVKKALDGATAEELHGSWCQQKFADGWVYGEFKDENIKTHPCLVPYDKLPEAQQLKDHMFRAIVKAFKLNKQYANIS